MYSTNIFIFSNSKNYIEATLICYPRYHQFIKVKCQNVFRVFYDFDPMTTAVALSATNCFSYSWWWNMACSRTLQFQLLETYLIVFFNCAFRPFTTTLGLWPYLQNY